MDWLDFNTHLGCSPYQLWPQVLLSLQVHAPLDWGKMQNQIMQSNSLGGHHALVLHVHWKAVRPPSSQLATSDRI